LVFRPVTIVAILLRKTLLELSIQHRTNFLILWLQEQSSQYFYAF